MEYLKEMRKDGILLNAIILIVGIILAVWPGETLNVAVNLIGSIIVIFGVVNISTWFALKGVNYISLFLGILAIILGICVILRSDIIISILHILIGIAVLAKGISDMKVLVDVKTASKSWYALFISSIVTIILGLLLIFEPLMIASFVTRLGGIVFIWCALEGILIYFKVGKVINAKK